MLEMTKGWSLEEKVGEEGENCKTLFPLAAIDDVVVVLVHVRGSNWLVGSVRVYESWPTKRIAKGTGETKRV